ncbi:aldo/keto reductase [Planctomyces sp. SH-PL62]|uniref:aldo/keto reductase n=1 Tax=Planctomyces sp. SH-PL62 TaxID=1636152 RepID=UPI00078BE4C9|nr:aldo/keto reductase [Planctomyces sp. SH-PL62]AMV37209.1 General stress protein 69 [Planctomyces sp. SH-PL62]
MERRKVGGSELEVVPLALGGNVFGWTIDEAASFRVLDGFVAAGLNFIDTADVYSRWAPGNRGGESETILGKWFKASGKRDQVVLATKVGMDMGDGKVGLSKSYILRAAEDSLRRLQTDRIDLYQTHKDQDPETPQQETLEAYDQLIKEGKVRVIGASNFTAERLAEALKIAADTGLPRYQCLQPHYNLVERADFEAELGPFCLKENIGVIPYYSLASGFLTGKYRREDDLSKSPARSTNVKKYLNDRGFRVLDALDQVASGLKAKPASVALAWLLARPGVTAPIAGANSVEQLDDLVQALSIKLDAEAMKLLDDASA